MNKHLKKAAEFLEEDNVRAAVACVLEYLTELFGSEVELDLVEDPLIRAPDPADMMVLAGVMFTIVRQHETVRRECEYTRQLTVGDVLHSALSKFNQERQEGQ